MTTLHGPCTSAARCAVVRLRAPIARLAPWRPGQCRTVLWRRAAASGPTAEQPSNTAKQPEEQESAVASTSGIPEAAGPDLDVQDAEALDVEVADEDYIFGFLEPSESTNISASTSFGALGAAYAVVGGGLAAAAVMAPQLVVPVDPSSSAWAATLLACVAATCIRAAGVSFHLMAAAKDGQLLCLRHQRLSGFLAAFAALAAISQLLGPASPQLAGVTLLLSAATVLVCRSVALAALDVGPIVSAVALAQEFGQGWSVLLDTWGQQLRSVAGVLLLLTGGLALYGGCSLLLSSAPLWFMPAPAPDAWAAATDPSYSAAAAGLRRLVGAGMLLLAASAHGLMDHAAGVVKIRSLEDMGRALAARTALQANPTYAKYLLPGFSSYAQLCWAFVASAALQAWAVARAPGLGIDVNWDGALWGPLYGTWVLAGLYGLVLLFGLDWGSVWGVLNDWFNWACRVAYGLFGRLFWQWEWAEVKQ